LAGASLRARYVPRMRRSVLGTDLATPRWSRRCAETRGQLVDAANVRDIYIRSGDQPDAAVSALVAIA
jgi:hypothetical protein